MTKGLGMKHRCRIQAGSEVECMIYEKVLKTAEGDSSEHVVVFWGLKAAFVLL